MKVIVITDPDDKEILHVVECLPGDDEGDLTFAQFTDGMAGTYAVCEVESAEPAKA